MDTTVAVLMGGMASEHDISIKTGTVITNALDRAKYRVLPVLIGRDGHWHLPDSPLTGDAKWLPTADTPPTNALVPTIPDVELVERGVDVVFIGLHGRYGEDGCIQGLLEILGIPYTGSDVMSSALAMDKVRSKEIVSFHGVQTPPWQVVTASAWRTDRDGIIARIEETFGYPCVVKIPEEGSSFGMGIPDDRAELEAIFDEHATTRGRMLVEEYIKGTEITCAVLGALPGEEPLALPLTEIIPKTSKYFDFEAKYTPGASEEITPARLDEKLTAKAQHVGVTSHSALGCGGMSRTDMIVRDGEIYYLETNTIPGMTETSLYPQAAAAVGMSFPDLLSKQIELALVYHGKKA
jgi:D-alanine-D-alanine ligase